MEGGKREEGGGGGGGGGGCFYFSNHSIPCPSVPYFEGTLPSHCEHILVCKLESCIRNRTAIVLSNIMQHVLGSNNSVCIGYPMNIIYNIGTLCSRIYPPDN